MCKFRDLTADEIEVRIGQVYENGLTLLLYKDARCDMNILDEIVHPENWQREHYECKGNLFCRVGINVNYDKPDAPEKWMWKSDCGTESNTEAQKGEASDSFKRACVNWGIGRELYTSPFIWINNTDCKITTDNTYQGKTKYKCKEKFSVEKIKIENKRIVALVIKNESNGKVVFDWEDKKAKNASLPTYAECLATVIDFGEHSGKTLQEIFKADRGYVNALLNDDTVPLDIRNRINIINQEIKKANKK